MSLADELVVGDVFRSRRFFVGRVRCRLSLVLHALLCSLQAVVGRRVIEDGMYVKQLKVEVYLYTITLAQYGDESKEKCLTRTFSRASTIGTKFSLNSSWFHTRKNYQGPWTSGRVELCFYNTI